MEVNLHVGGGFSDPGTTTLLGPVGGGTAGIYVTGTEGEHSGVHGGCLCTRGRGVGVAVKIAELISVVCFWDGGLCPV